MPTDAQNPAFAFYGMTFRCEPGRFQIGQQFYRSRGRRELWFYHRSLPEYRRNGRTAGHYSVNFENLQPDTKFCYRVGDGKTWSEWNIFRTAGSKPGPFRFIYVGDAQNGIKSLWSRTIRTAYAAAPDARFIVHAGDLVAEGYDDGQSRYRYRLLRFRARVDRGAYSPFRFVVDNQPGGSSAQ